MVVVPTSRDKMNESSTNFLVPPADALLDVLPTTEDLLAASLECCLPDKGF
jgi:hypothetical protein